MQEQVALSFDQRRAVASLAGLFGAVALLLAGVGLYGVTAYSVTQRTGEIGIRMALGAGPFDIGEMIGIQALAMVVIGVALGLGAAFVLTPFMRALLYGVAPSDPASMLLAALLVTMVAAAATTIPAFHAVRIEPASALREEN